MCRNGICQTTKPPQSWPTKIAFSTSDDRAADEIAGQMLDVIVLDRLRRSIAP
jgi:hypothetical protein